MSLRPTKASHQTASGQAMRKRLVLVPGRSHPDRKEAQQVVGANIYRLRLARKLTATQLANATGMNTAVLLSIELGDKNIQLSRLVRIARRLGVLPEKLLNGVR